MLRETSSKPETTWFGILDAHGSSLTSYQKVGSSRTGSSSPDAGGVNDSSPLHAALDRHSDKQPPKVAWPECLTTIVNAFFMGESSLLPYSTDPRSQ